MLFVCGSDDDLLCMMVDFSGENFWFIVEIANSPLEVSPGIVSAHHWLKQAMEIQKSSFCRYSLAHIVGTFSDFFKIGDWLKSIDVIPTKFFAQC